MIHQIKKIYIFSLIIILTNCGTNYCIKEMLPRGPYNNNNPSNRYDNNNVPSQKGIYRIVDNNNNVNYVGRANDLFRRQGQHMASGKLGDNDTFQYKVVHGNTSVQTLDKIETNVIKTYNPPLNKYKK